MNVFDTDNTPAFIVGKTYRYERFVNEDKTIRKNISFMKLFHVPMLFEGISLLSIFSTFINSNIQSKIALASETTAELIKLVFFIYAIWNFYDIQQYFLELQTISGIKNQESMTVLYNAKNCLNIKFSVVLFGIPLMILSVCKDICSYFLSIRCKSSLIKIAELHFTGFFLGARILALMTCCLCTFTSLANRKKDALDLKVSFFSSIYRYVLFDTIFTINKVLFAFSGYIEMYFTLTTWIYIIVTVFAFTSSFSNIIKQKEELRIFVVPILHEIQSLLHDIFLCTWHCKRQLFLLNQDMFSTFVAKTDSSIDKRQNIDMSFQLCLCFCLFCSVITFISMEMMCILLNVSNIRAITSLSIYDALFKRNIKFFSLQTNIFKWIDFFYKFYGYSLIAILAFIFLRECNNTSTSKIWFFTLNAENYDVDLLINIDMSNVKAAIVFLFSYRVWLILLCFLSFTFLELNGHFFLCLQNISSIEDSWLVPMFLPSAQVDDALQNVLITNNDTVEEAANKNTNKNMILKNLLKLVLDKQDTFWFSTYRDTFLKEHIAFSLKDFFSSIRFFIIMEALLLNVIICLLIFNKDKKIFHVLLKSFWYF